MKYCENRYKEFGTKEAKYPICGCILVEKEDGNTAATVATITIPSIL